MFYIILPSIALIAVFLIYFKTKVYFDDGIDYNSTEAARIVYTHIHNEVITENKNTEFKYYQFNNINIPYIDGHRVIENLLICPQGIFIFIPIHYENKVTLTDIGFLLSGINNLPEKISINTLLDYEIINYLYDHFSNINNLDIHYFTLFTSELNVNTKINNLISINQVKHVVESKPAILSKNDIQQIIGQLTVLESKAPKNKKSLLAA